MGVEVRHFKDGNTKVIPRVLNNFHSSRKEVRRQNENKVLAIIFTVKKLLLNIFPQTGLLSTSSHYCNV